jgi:hypothetical protein
MSAIESPRTCGRKSMHPSEILAGKSAGFLRFYRNTCSNIDRSSPADFIRDINVADSLRFGVEHTSEQPKLQNAAKQIVALAAKNNVQTTSCKQSEARTKFALSCDPSMADKLPTAIDFSPSAKACPACQRACDSSARRLLTVAWIDRFRRVSSPLQTVRSTSDADDNPARRLRCPL